MPNRAERRAKSKNGGVPQQYDRTRGRGRSGMLDEYQLQERSRRLVENGTTEWKPSAVEVVENYDKPEYRNPKMRAPHSVRQWFRAISWLLIVLSVIGFFAMLVIRIVPLWATITVSSVFAVAVLSLFIVAGDPKDNPNLDANGTAV